MNILIIGGKLQGTEIAYLAKKAGFTVHLVDHDPFAAAINLSDYFYPENIFDVETMLAIFENVDVVIPALEDYDSLRLIESYGAIVDTAVISDAKAFQLSSSKNRSNAFLKENHIPIPRDYLACLTEDLPVVVKPSEGSGSEDVRVFKKASDAEDFIRTHPEYIGQEYLEGPSYSIEVIGNGNNFQALVITEIIVDENFDCQRVVAPATITKKLEQEFRNLALKIAAALKIKGIFDIEVIENRGKLYVLEIDARMPSQTPIAVYHATGINMVKAVVNYTIDGPFDINPIWQRYSLLQHVWLKGKTLSGIGEGVMGAVGPLIHQTNYFEADEALISDAKLYDGYVAELLVSANSPHRAKIKMQRAIKQIEQEFRIREDRHDTIKCGPYGSHQESIQRKRGLFT